MVKAVLGSYLLFFYYVQICRHSVISNGLKNGANSCCKWGKPDILDGNIWIGFTVMEKVMFENIIKKFYYLSALSQ